MGEKAAVVKTNRGRAPCTGHTARGAAPVTHNIEVKSKHKQCNIMIVLTVRVMMSLGLMSRFISSRMYLGGGGVGLGVGVAG